MEKGDSFLYQSLNEMIDNQIVVRPEIIIDIISAYEKLSLQSKNNLIH